MRKLLSLISAILLALPIGAQVYKGNFYYEKANVYYFDKFKNFESNQMLCDRPHRPLLKEHYEFIDSIIQAYKTDTNRCYAPSHKNGIYLSMESQNNPYWGMFISKKTIEVFFPDNDRTLHISKMPKHLREKAKEIVDYYNTPVKEKYERYDSCEMEYRPEGYMSGGFILIFPADILREKACFYVKRGDTFYKVDYYYDFSVWTKKIKHVKRYITPVPYFFKYAEMPKYDDCEWDIEKRIPKWKEMTNQERMRYFDNIIIKKGKK